MFRIIHNSLKHLYYGSILNLWAAKIERFFTTRSIEKNIKERGDTILSNRSYIGQHSTYTTKLPKRKDGLNSCEIHGGKYKFHPLYTTQQQIDDISKMSSFGNNRISELDALLKVLIDAENKVRLKNKNNDL